MVTNSGCRQEPRNFGEIKVGGLRESHAIATWNSGPSQHLLKDRNTKKSCVEFAGRRTFLMRADLWTAVRQTAD
jgi:hypothetical protein